MLIRKRNGLLQDYNQDKIKNAIIKAFLGLGSKIDDNEIDKMISDIEKDIIDQLRVEVVQDRVEETLMQYGYHQEAKAYILYRQKHTENRLVINELLELLKDKQLKEVLEKIQRDFIQDEYSLKLLLIKLRVFYKDSMSVQEVLKVMIKASEELISRDAPKWEFIAARFLTYDIHQRVNQRMKEYSISTFYEKLSYLTQENYYGQYILENYTQSQVDELSLYIQEDRNELFTYSGLELVMKRYLIETRDYVLLEKPQEMFMGIAMHLAMNEKDKLKWAKEIYDVLSTLKVTMASPTMSNARKPFHQMSSCFIDTVSESLEGIYKSLDNFAQVSKFGGGYGLILW